MKPLAVLLCVLAAMLLGAGLTLLWHLRLEDRLASRVTNIRRRLDLSVEPAALQSGHRLYRPVAALGAVIARSGLLSGRTLAELQATLNTAGLRGQTGLSVFVGAKLLLLLALPISASALITEIQWWPSFWPALIGGAGVLGLLLPDVMVRSRRKSYLLALERGLPDALDMLVICSEAGLGLEAAFERVSQEIGQGHSVVAQEMRITLQEMRINADRRAALVGLGKRTGLESLRRLGSTLVQTMQFGTPLSQALSTLSAEMRQEMLTRFEGRASKLPVLLTVPMIVFILPCVFLVVGGPALVQLMQSFYK